MKISYIIILISLLGISLQGLPQDNEIPTPGGRDALLRIYIDCPDCDLDHIRNNFREVNYVTEPYDADVHIRITEQKTASGGSLYNIYLKGKGRFESDNYNFSFTVPGLSTWAEVRDDMLENIKLSLVPYLMKTPSREKMMLFIIQDSTCFQETDKWKNWMFTLSGDGSYSKQEMASMMNIMGSAYISKITTKIKLESVTSLLLNHSKYNLYDGDTLLLSIDYKQNSIHNYTQFVKSLGEHWGIGGIGGFLKSDYSNLDYQFQAGPVLEYNVFRYSEADNKRLLFNYRILYQYAAYNQMTIYNKMNDQLYKQELRIRFCYLDDWGSFNATAWGRSYLNRRSFFSTGMNMSINLGPFRNSKALKGFSFYISGGAAYIKDQISLTNTIDDEGYWLPNQYELKSDFNFNGSIGISYTFGSTSNNAVNIRFDP